MYNIWYIFTYFFLLNKWPQNPKMFQSGKNITGYVDFIKIIKDFLE